jgi:hypothetical protein
MVAMFLISKLINSLSDLKSSAADTAAAASELLLINKIK